jgi:UDP-N-acetylglucosamine 2-epimerase (non-hydrolysing)
MGAKKILFICGTRPEAIKMAPLIKLAKQQGLWQVIVCATAQHRNMLDQVLEFFAIKPDYDLDLMQPNQNLLELTSIGLVELQKVISETKPDLIFVQGDTTTAFIGALAGFYAQVPIAHIEAGLRSGDKSSPYPEEAYRCLISQLAKFHFTPTQVTCDNLAREFIHANVHIVGNTVIDAMLRGLEILAHSPQDQINYTTRFNFLDPNRKLILVTCHRRESFGEGVINLCSALKYLAENNNDIQILIPLHPNPNIKGIIEQELGGMENISLIQPLEYPAMLWLMKKCYVIITDSGGIQEEAPSLGKPVLVVRDVTERVEAISAGTAKLVGIKERNIIDEATKLLSDESAYKRMADVNNPYGDGTSSDKILSIIAQYFSVDAKGNSA